MSGYNRYLFHFTCCHAAQRIDVDGVLRPQISWRQLDELLARNGEPLTGLWRAPAVVWLTHERNPTRESVGLTSHTLKCDRMEFRYSVANTGEAWMWPDFARHYGANQDYLDGLDGNPSLWWVVPGPIQVVSKIERKGVPCLTHAPETRWKRGGNAS